MKVKNMALCGLFVALLTVCAWICIPFGPIAITLQTFAVCLCLGLLGGKLGTITILVYLLLGAVGVPVFSGFRGGAAVLMGINVNRIITVTFSICPVPVWMRFFFPALCPICSRMPSRWPLPGS